MAKENRLVYANEVKEIFDYEVYTGETDLFDAFDSAIVNATTVDAIPLTADELKYLINDTIAYICQLEKKGFDKPEFGYDSRKALLEKLKQFQEEHFPEKVCSG